MEDALRGVSLRSCCRDRPQEKCLLPGQHWSPQTRSCCKRRLNASRFPLGGHLPFGLLEGLTAEERAEQDSLRGSGSCHQARRPSCRCLPALCSEPHRAIPHSLLLFQKQEVISWSPSRMACAISLTPMGSPSDPSYLETSPLSGWTCLANAPRSCFPFSKEKKNQKTETKANPNGLELMTGVGCPGLNLGKMSTVISEGKEN